MRRILSKDEFVSIMENIRSVYEYQDSLNAFFSKNGVDGYIFQPDCMSSALRLLHIIWGEADVDNWIEYFCFELDFGKKWKPGLVVGKDGSDIKMGSAEDLYVYLCSCE